MRRHAIGVIAIALLGVGIFFLIWPPQDSALQWLHGSSVRIGVVLLTVWLAWPEISRVPRWMYGLVAAGILIVEEAGGRVTAADAGPVPADGSSVVATNAHLHTAVMERIRDV